MTVDNLLRRMYESMRTCGAAWVALPNPVDAPKPNVVPGAFVLGTRVSKTDNDGRSRAGIVPVFLSEEFCERTAYHRIPP